MPIHVLPPDIINKIAAGEVIERPASVAKELLENAIDAGATHIQVSIEQGGRRLIQVADNGCGIASDQVKVAFARHATSKLDKAEDLYHIETLGFRGEALASIAAVSHLTLSTRTVTEPVGTIVRYEGGQLMETNRQGRPAGTTVAIEQLFFNTPARKKFLRADSTEAGHVARLVSSYALAYPSIRFSFKKNGRAVFSASGTGKLLDALVAVYGAESASQMVSVVSVDDDDSNIQVDGYTSEPGFHRSNRSDLVLFVNHRWIHDNTLNYAITEAYRGLLPQRRYPLAVINISLPAEDVDVNIHPTKREVRFRQARDVFRTVQRAVRRAILSTSPVRLTDFPSTVASQHQYPQRLELGLEQSARQQPISYPQKEEMPSPVQQSNTRLPMLRVVGQIAQTYIIAEGPGGMYMIDQHAAHERIRFEQIQSRNQKSMAVQDLLQPLTIDVTPQQASLIEAHTPDLEKLGFSIEPFGGSTFLVRSVPAELVGESITNALSEMLDTETTDRAWSWKEQAEITLACHTAIRAGKTLTVQEMQQLVRELEQCEIPHTCPHGRPTLVHFSSTQLERQFGRI